MFFLSSMIIGSRAFMPSGVSSTYLKKLSPGWLQTTLRMRADARMSEYKKIDNLILAQGVVETGYGRGSKKLGFPTANLPHFDKEISKSDIMDGVYIGWARIQSESTLFPCIANIGKSPTFVGEENRVRIIESYLLSSSEGVIPDDFYGQILKVALVGFIRPEMKFSGLDELVGQINHDVESADRILGQINYNESCRVVAREFLTRTIPASSVGSNQITFISA